MQVEEHLKNVAFDNTSDYVTLDDDQSYDDFLNILSSRFVDDGEIKRSQFEVMQPLGQGQFGSVLHTRFI